MEQVQPLQTELPPKIDAPIPPQEVPARFKPSKKVLFIDRFMTRFINVGGISIITAVLGIFVFILWQILPMFGGAKVTKIMEVSAPNQAYKVLGVDEWGELPFLLQADGKIIFLDLAKAGKLEAVDPGFSEQKNFTAFRYDSQKQEVIAGTSDGYFSIISIGYESAFENGKRDVVQHAKAGPFYQLAENGGKILEIGYGHNDSGLIVAAIQELNGKPEIVAVTLTETKSLMGSGETEIGNRTNLTSGVIGEPVHLLVNQQGSQIDVVTKAGDVFYFEVSDDGPHFVQKFRPFEDLQNPSVQTMDFLLGGVSLVLTNPTGNNIIYSLYIPEGAERRVFGKTKEFEQLPRGAEYYSPSVRNKAFLIGEKKFASLRFGTTAAVRWQEELPFSVDLGAMGGKYNRIVFLDTAKKVHFYSLDDPHPESSLKALFGKIWYEGYSAPGYFWQSTGSTDDFEPKLSMVPLLIGTLKGTFYAMLFAVPIALLAAIYTSQFLHPNFRIIVKPTMEIMASLPSVVLGFLAALWLAPVLETRVPTILIALVLLPLSAMLFGWAWGLLPVRYRIWIKPGYEWIAFVPLFLLAIYLSWILGPGVERLIFVVSDPDTGKKVADFRQWWVHVTDLPFEQRNSLVVGFMMGFAVIPIVFTITEDALSNVPAALRSGSLALGASRWQTAIRIVLPTASAGIFSAAMIGLGRAIGETMIVVMATGNTPIMDFNIFSGMRTLSANIAVELPEAPVAGTLYRTLFLGAMALFMLTFLINTFAEILRQHLREKYKTV
jgi:phosphate transport system permease protein